MNPRKPCPTALTDEQWNLLKPMLPPDKLRGRKRQVDLREIVNAILYLLRTGCSWRKRHILVDTFGLFLWVTVHSAGTQDRDGARLVLVAIKGRFARLTLIWADSAYACQLVTWVHRHIRSVLEVGTNSGLAAEYRPDGGALFRAAISGRAKDGRLSDRTIRRIITHRPQAAGVEGRVGGHSLRVGSAQSLATAGASLVEMQVAGRWESPDMPGHYVHGQLARQGAVARLR